MAFASANLAVNGNEITGSRVARVTKILAKFEVDPSIVAEVYDAVLVAKAQGKSQSTVFAKFVSKYKISPQLQGDIEAAFAAID